MFFGVFVPCVLSIFSVILFLRLGFVIGQSGFSGALAMLLGSYFVVGLTILSISAISTNGVIHGGGAYYMIRSVSGGGAYRQRQVLHKHSRHRTTRDEEAKPSHNAPERARLV